MTFSSACASMNFLTGWAEALKAAAATASPALAARAIHVLFAQFLDRPFPGVWIDHFDEALRPRVDFIPSTSLYHLVLAASAAETAFAST